MRSLPLEFPETHLDQLQTCALRKDALQAWLNALPLAHPQACQSQLATLLDEFNQLKFPPPRRLEWLHLIAQPVQQVAQELDKCRHLAQEGEAAQQLDRQLAEGYKRALHDLLQHRDQFPAQVLGPALLQAIYHATRQLSALIRRSCQFSIAAPSTAWRELYLLYRLACQSRLQKRKLQEEAPSNCEEAYYQALLLGIIHADDLRSDEVHLLYPLLAEWSRKVEVTAPESSQASFQVLSEYHFQPVRALQERPVNQEQDFGLNTQGVAEALQQHLENNSSAVSNRLLQHLLAQLDTTADRNAPRIQASGQLQMVLGLRSVHFHLSGRKPFEQQVAGGNLSLKEKSNPFLERTPPDDPWSAAYDAQENKSSGQVLLVEMEPTSLSTSVDDELKQRFPIYELQQVNTSATGYCLEWQGEAPRNLATGELVALQEKPSDPWQPAVIRWVRQAPQGYQLGVELLPSRMQPCAIKPLIKVGDPIDYMPGFLIPELSILGTPPSVITPLLPFKEGQKVDITGSQGRVRTRLVQLLSTPGEFNQFQLESLEPQKHLTTAQA